MEYYFTKSEGFVKVGISWGTGLFSFKNYRLIDLLRVYIVGRVEQRETRQLSEPGFARLADFQDWYLLCYMAFIKRKTTPIKQKRRHTKITFVPKQS